jgi:thioesterase domain-containing protein
VLTGWAWLTRYVDSRDIDADAVIQESSMQFLLPVTGTLRAVIAPPATADIGKFHKLLLRAGRGRIRLRVEMHQDDKLAVVFDGLFAAAMRRREI